MCLFPTLIKNPKYKPNKKNGGNVPIAKDNRVMAIPIGCGYCIECRKQKAREWQTRLNEDIKHNKNGKFVTLTFSNESIKKFYEHQYVDKDTGEIIKHEGYDLDNAAAKLAVHLFRGRWRKKYKKEPRHWLITELGHEGTENIHLHGIIWEDDISQLAKIWGYGWVWDGREDTLGNKINYVSEETANYCIKYINKQDLKHKYYKPRILSSKGIGSGYFKRTDTRRHEYKKGETVEYYKTREGYTLAIPKLWRNKLWSEEERESLWLDKLDKNERYVLGIKYDISENDEKYKEALKYAQRENLKKGYGSNKIDWNEKGYEEQRRNLLQNQRMKNIKDTLPYGAKAELWQTTTKASKGITPNKTWDITAGTEEREAEF